MLTARNTARWRQQPLLPANYDDLASLVQIARKVRGKTVECDLAFTELDLLSLRRAAYEWGSPVRGRYKAFDASVLAAINAALGERDSILSLSHPSNTTRLDFAVSCIPADVGFRLFGHASFDVLFGYGAAAVDHNAVGSIHLAEGARQALVNAVGMLGWDLQRLQEERFRPVRNVLYGLPITYGVVKETTSQPATDIPLHFFGPYCAFDHEDDRCIFADPRATSVGIYLWTVTVDGCPWPHYVGQTRRGFGQRMGEHIAAYLSGQYPTLDPTALCRGENRRASGSPTETWPRSLPAFLTQVHTLVPTVIDLIHVFRFHLAPLAGNQHLFDRVEGVLGRYFKRHPDPRLRDFFCPGLRVPAALPNDSPIRLLLSSDVPLTGLPSEIME